MFRLIVLAFALGFATPAVAYGSFCDGYDAGFQAGKCHDESYCIPAVPPVCPVPRAGERSYRDGYNRGFVDGLRERR